LAGLAKKTEEAVRQMVKASKAREPAKSVADAMKKKDAKNEEAAKAALDELQGILKGEPWNLP
jgi:hypothetical protein